jgi:hypothetical protein
MASLEERRLEKPSLRSGLRDVVQPDMLSSLCRGARAVGPNPFSRTGIGCCRWGKATLHEAGPVWRHMQSIGMDGMFSFDSWSIRLSAQGMGRLQRRMSILKLAACSVNPKSELLQI